MSLVSVIIPTYNGESYITKAIDSVLNQTYNNYEVLVIDDGSTDNTRNVLNRYGKAINYIYQEHQGVSNARNLGIKKAKGKFISFLDADDLYLPEHLESQVNYLERHSILGMVSSGWLRVNATGNVISENQPWKVLPNLNIETWLISRPVLPSAITIRKEWLKKVNAFNPEFTLAQDIELVLRLAIEGCQAGWSEKVTCCYRTSSSNATNNTVKQAKFFDLVFERFFDNNNLPESILLLEKKAKYSYLKWLGWRLYHTKNYSLMATYLSKSLAYSEYSITKTICDWIEYFSNCSSDEGYELDAYSLSNLTEWKQLIKYFIGEFRNSESKTNIREENLILRVGQYLENQQDIDRAIKHYQTAIKIKPNLSKVKRQLEALLNNDSPQERTSTFNSSNRSDLIEFKVFPSKELFLLPSISYRDLENDSFRFSKHNTPEAYVTAIKRGRAFVNGESSYIITSDNKYVEDLCCNIESFDESLDLPKCKGLNGSVAFLALGKRQEGYLDSIFNLIARFKLLQLSGMDLNYINTFVVDKCHLNCTKEILELIGIDLSKVVTVEEYNYISADILFVPSFTCDRQKISRWAVESIRKDIQAKIINDKQDRSQLLYIKYDCNTQTEILNEPELIAKLKQMNFATIDFNSISLFEQLSYIVNAKVIITGNKTVLNYIHLCRIGTKIVEICTNNTSNTHWIISNICSLEHYHIVADKSTIKHEDLAITNNLVTVNLNHLEEILHKSEIVNL